MKSSLQGVLILAAGLLSASPAVAAFSAAFGPLKSFAEAGEARAALGACAAPAGAVGPIALADIAALAARSAR